MSHAELMTGSYRYQPWKDVAQFYRGEGMRNYTVLQSQPDSPLNVPVKMFTRGVAVEQSAIEQIIGTARLPFVEHMAVMADAHRGMGSTIGTVVATKGAIVPAAVGVDLGCGMMAVRTYLRAMDLPDDLSGVRRAIEKAVPCGRTNDGGPSDRGAWHDVPGHVAMAWESNHMGERLGVVTALAPKLERAARRAIHHLGTLGTGNHFIEVCLDEEDRVWVMLHSGSRGIGNAIGRHYIALAREDMRRWFINLPDEDLAYIPDGSEFFKPYLASVEWAQDFARLNRELMMVAVLSVLANELKHPRMVLTETAVQCHHNYVARESHGGEDLLVTRKGAVRAREGDLGIIPGSMGARSYIVEGLGDPDSLHSCSHGAGRAMSRGDARRRFTVADHEAATAGIECEKGEGVLDETPAAYKSIDAVMAAQTSQVRVLHELRQVVNVKGVEDQNGFRARKRKAKEEKANAGQVPGIRQVA